MEWKHDYQSYIAGKSQVFLLNYGWNYVEQLWRGGKGQIISSNYALHRILEMFTTIIWTRGRGKGGRGHGGEGTRGEGGNRAPIFHREREGASTPNSKFDNFIQGQKEFTKPNFNLPPTPLLSLQQLVSGTWPLLGSPVMEQSSIERAEMLWSFQIYLNSFDVLFSGIYREHSPSSGPNVVLVHWSDKSRLIESDLTEPCFSSKSGLLLIQIQFCPTE